ncbi:MAG: aminotransferase class III-fold pyridoxal phosphate-dependent enzyme, partial [Acidobacteria bacterium]|nr:aminotransferase class III-fold pyridoxal phosphate-dependent enzyme [Acidobacteriota bacterium]
LHGTTFGGGPMICAAALEFLSTVEREKLLANVRARGEELRAGLEKLKAKFDFVKEVRGEGLILGMELAIEGAAIVQEALRRGVIINCTHERTLRFLPPFIVTSKQVKEFLAALESVLASAARKSKAAPAQPAAAAAGSAR